MQFFCLGLRDPLWLPHTKFSTPFINTEQSKAEDDLEYIPLYCFKQFEAVASSPSQFIGRKKKIAAASGLSAITVVYTMI